MELVKYEYAGNPWISIPGCTMLLGAQSADPGKPNYDNLARMNEGPVHKISLTPFKISKYPVMVCDYEQFIEDGGYKREEFWSAGGWQTFSSPRKWEDQRSTPTRPVVGVSWFEAAAFAAWSGVELPCEAQWERAARGMATYRIYPWGEAYPGKQIAICSHGVTLYASPVSHFPADCTPEGVMQMGGNVLEWCSDWYTSAEFYAVSDGYINPANSETGTDEILGDRRYRVLRGGCWAYSDPISFRCSSREYGNPWNRGYARGFRLISK